MYLNTFLYMFGLDPDNFVNELVEPFESDDGTIIYNLRQRTDIGICKICGKTFTLKLIGIYSDSSKNSYKTKQFILALLNYYEWQLACQIHQKQSIRNALQKQHGVDIIL